MKRLLFILPIAFISVQCAKNCDEKPTTCGEEPPTGVTCQAYWESWVYNSETNNCEYIGYSGCGPIGFETQKECEVCECNE